MENPPDWRDIRIAPEMLAGVWANEVVVTLGEQEFTLDFVRLDHATGNPPTRGAHVARVACSALLVTRLIERLEEAWRRYAETTMPKEVRGEDGLEGLEADGLE